MFTSLLPTCLSLSCCLYHAVLQVTLRSAHTIRSCRTSAHSRVPFLAFPFAIQFVTKAELEQLGLTSLVGTKLLRAYMHGFFIDMRLYGKAKAIAEPFAYEDYRKQAVKKRIEEKRANRIGLVKKLPKVNKDYAATLMHKNAQDRTQVGDWALFVCFL